MSLRAEKFSELEIEMGLIISRSVSPILEKNFSEEQNVFLIGKDINEKDSMRRKIYNVLSEKRNINAYFPEEIFEDQLFQKEHDLLSLENMLAESVDAVVMCIESAGSIAELGAFSNSRKLNEKLIVYVDEKYKNDMSFINLGPLKYLKKGNKSKVVWFDFTKEKIDKKDSFKLMRTIREFKKVSSVRVDLTNPLFAEKFLLALIYVFGTVSRKKIVEIIKRIVEEEGKITKRSQGAKIDVNYIITISSSSLSMLVKNRRLKLNSNGEYSLSIEGRTKLIVELKSNFISGKLDRFRMLMLNYQLRKYRA